MPYYNSDATKKLQEATFKHDLPGVRAILSQHPDIRARCEPLGHNVLHVAAMWGYLDIAEALIAHDPDIVNSRTRDDETTPLHVAAYYGNLEIVRLLIDNKAYTNSPQRYGNRPANTPLHMAAMSGELEVVKYLIANGAKSNAINHLNETPRDLASNYGYKEIVTFFQEQLPELERLLKVWALWKLDYQLEHNNNLLSWLPEEVTADVLDWVYPHCSEISQSNPLFFSPSQPMSPFVRKFFEDTEKELNNRPSRTTFHF